MKKLLTVFAIREKGKDEVRERLETGVHWTLMPGVNLARKVYKF